MGCRAGVVGGRKEVVAGRSQQSTTASMGKGGEAERIWETAAAGLMDL